MVRSKGDATVISSTPLTRGPCGVTWTSQTDRILFAPSATTKRYLSGIYWPGRLRKRGLTSFHTTYLPSVEIIHEILTNFNLFCKKYCVEISAQCHLHIFFRFLKILNIREILTKLSQLRSHSLLPPLVCLPGKVCIGSSLLRNFT